MKRRRYFSEPGKEYWYPLDESLELSRMKVSKRFSKAAIQLAVLAPFDHAKKLMKDLLFLNPSVTLLEQIVDRFGTTLHRTEEKNGQRPHAISDRETGAEVLYIQADGAMVPLWGEKCREFKENKLGMVFNDKDIVTRKMKSGDETQSIVRKKFVSSLAEGVEPFKKMLFASAVKKGYHTAQNVVFLCDGAAWLAKCRNEYFPTAIQILDWYHAVEHLWETARKMYGENNMDQCHQWVGPLEGLLWEGKVETVISHLEDMAKSRKKHQTILYELRGYYVSNREHMRYDEFRKKGWYIGSGSIESANKYIISQRLKQSGMLWSKCGADAIIWARCKYFEGDWDAFWDSVNISDYLNNQPKEAAKAA